MSDKPDQQSIASIQATGAGSTPDTEVFSKVLRAGQFTSPTRITRSWVRFRGFVANDDQGVRVLVLRWAKDATEPTLHEARHEGWKPEGPGLALEIIGDDLCYTITEHLNVSGTRPNAVQDGRFVGLAAPPDQRDFLDVKPEDWSYPFVMACARRGVISGYSDGSFRPGNGVTRAQLAKILSLALEWVE